jgi:predicted anti-sigma-YlaC factor YlaD
MNEHFTTDSLIDYIHGELPPAEDALAHAHLQSCGPCRAEFDRESALREALRLAARQQELELPSMLKAQIWAAVREQRPPLGVRLLAALRPAIALPAIAILAIVTYFATPLGHGASGPKTVDAMYYFEQHAAEALQEPLAERSLLSPVLETSTGDTAAAPPASAGVHAAVAAALDAVE